MQARTIKGNTARERAYCVAPYSISAEMRVELTVKVSGAARAVAGHRMTRRWPGSRRRQSRPRRRCRKKCPRPRSRPRHHDVHVGDRGGGVGVAEAELATSVARHHVAAGAGVRASQQICDPDPRFDRVVQVIRDQDAELRPVGRTGRRNCCKSPTRIHRLCWSCRSCSWCHRPIADS